MSNNGMASPPDPLSKGEGEIKRSETCRDNHPLTPSFARRGN